MPTEGPNADVAGVYWGRFVLVQSGKREHFPPGRSFRIVLWAD
jgi:hypothetical protein